MIDYKELSKKELIDLPYEKLANLINALTPNQSIESSNKIVYPVFTRFGMDVLRHKFLLLQDGEGAISVNEKYYYKVVLIEINGLVDGKN